MSAHPAADLFPLLEGDEFDELVDDIRANGLLEPVWLTPDGLLLDGRNRVRACADAGVEVRHRVYDGDDPIGFVVSLNVQRRHLKGGQRAMIATNVLPLYEAEAERRRIESRCADRRNEPRSDDLAGKSMAVSGRAVSRAKRVREYDAEHGTDLADRVWSGELALDAADKQVKRRKAQIEEQAAREITIDAILQADAEGEGWRMLHGDFRERLADLPDSSVDLIVTDPPYPAEFLPLYSDLSKHAARVLADQGILLCLTGGIFLPEVFSRLGEHLAYGWQYIQPLDGSHCRIMGRHIAQSYKPWVAFSNGTWPSGRIDWHADRLEANVFTKTRYRWEQDPTPAVMLIEELSSDGATVLDPFCGTGAYGSASLDAGRRFIGVEADADRFTGSVERLKGGGRL